MDFGRWQVKKSSVEEFRQWLWEISGKCQPLLPTYLTPVLTFSSGKLQTWKRISDLNQLIQKLPRGEETPGLICCNNYNFFNLSIREQNCAKQLSSGVQKLQKIRRITSHLPSRKYQFVAGESGKEKGQCWWIRMFSDQDQDPDDYKCDCFQPDNLHYACTDVTSL